MFAVTFFPLSWALPSDHLVPGEEVLSAWTVPPRLTSRLVKHGQLEKSFRNGVLICFSMFQWETHL